MTQSRLLTHYHTMRHFDALKLYSCGIHCEKKRNCLLQCFLSFMALIFYFNPFPHNKILHQTKMKAFADGKINVTKMIISVFDRIENIVGKGEIALPSQFFQKASFVDASKCVIVWERFKCTLKCHLQFVSVWTSLKFCGLLMG